MTAVTNGGETVYTEHIISYPPRAVQARKAALPAQAAPATPHAAMMIEDFTQQLFGGTEPMKEG